MVSGQVRLHQVMDSWQIMATVWEQSDTESRHYESEAMYQLPLTAEEHEADPLAAVLSAVQRWLDVTRNGGPSGA